MSVHNEMNLAIAFATFLVIVTFLLTLFWRRKNRADHRHGYNRAVWWFLAADLGLIGVAIAAFKEPVIGHCSTAFIVIPGIVFSAVLPFIGLMRAARAQMSILPPILAGIAVVAVQWAYILMGQATTASLMLLMSPLFGVLLLAMSWATLRIIGHAYGLSHAVVMAAPFGILGALYLMRLFVMIGFADEHLTMMFTAVIVLALGVETITFLFCLTLLTNLQVAEALTRARVAAEAASDAKSDFLRSMSHELRTPLNAIIGFSELMRNAKPVITTEQCARNAEHIHIAGRYLLKLVEDLLELTSPATSETRLDERPLELDTIVDEVFLMVREPAENAGVALGKSYSEPPPTIIADRRRLMQVLINLVTNALKATDRGGSIEIGCKRGADGALTLQVKDTGIGMAADEIKTALAVFGQIRPIGNGGLTGVGIGLPLSRDFMRAHGGDLEVESAPGEGTVVTVVIPADRVVDRAGADDDAISDPAGDQARKDDDSVPPLADSTAVRLIGASAEDKIDEEQSNGASNVRPIKTIDLAETRHAGSMDARSSSYSCNRKAG